MSFCSLEEAWGTDYANIYKKDDSMLTAMPEIDKNIDTTLLKDRDLTQVSKPIDRNSIDKDMGNYYLNKKDEIENNKLCDNFLEHFLECENCKRKVNQILDIHDTSSSQSLIEKFTNMEDNYLDIFIMILTGIFIIFILDCFVRLGRNFKR